MDGLTLKRKVTVGKLTPTYNDTSSATSRPSSRNSPRPTSRPPSPTKSFVSTSSPLATRPKAKVNSSAIRRTPSANDTRPPSPVKFTTGSRIRDGALSPPASTVGVGLRTQAKSTVAARAKPSKSISAATSSSSKPKSPSPELRNRSLTASADTLRTNPDSRKRQGSAAAVLHHTLSHSSLQAPSPSPPPTRTGPLRVAQSELGVPSRDNENVGISAPQPIKIRSKVTILAKNNNDAPPLPDFLAPSTTLNAPSSRPSTTRVRAGSVSSNVSSTNNTNTTPLPSTQSSLAYPITTATPAANPHRYAMRGSPASGLGLRSSFSSSSSPKYTPAPQDEFRPFAKTSIFPSSPSSSANGYNGVGLGGVARVIIDPVNIPLPPQSPPISSLSISSRSSVSASASRSSVSYAHEPGSSPESPGSISLHLNQKRRDESPQSLRTTLDTLVAYASARDDDISFEEGSPRVEEDKERKVKAEAKSNRKIADLEITNRSLLAINASLEKAKDRQAKEIRELKRKLRESRLILPPRTYRAVKSSLDPNEIGDDEEDIDSSDSENDDNGDIRSDSAADDAWGKDDDTYRRVKLMIENLLDSGRRALEETKEDYMDAKGPAKVLTAEEVESWRDTGSISAEEVESWRDTGSISGAGRLSDSEGHLDFDTTFDDLDDDYLSQHLTGHSPTPQPPTRNGSVIGLGLRTPNLLSTPSPTHSSPKPPPILITESR
ncbi:hypothetical protein P691DRAFT_754951 [Macrolepiota fuliginosa MF-IS2]|uniref:Uncharacterized protein n=1 Tax=Macrolepiota fuliginosa MF-IS2 TaxID=1400762 RepID=A0A9P5XML6_9AGAR|nr:hypothetical protein P691DRAFT_754951 [Macrolepiota fuliginosa MF-IS2]